MRPDHPFPHPMPMHQFAWGHLLFAGLGSLLWLGLLALIIFALVRAFSRPRAYAPPPTPTPAAAAGVGSAIELLRRRYAAGEIDATTFEQMLERLVASEAYEQTRGERTPPPM